MTGAAEKIEELLDYSCEQNLDRIALLFVL
jgi:hypothetical protein